MFASGGLVSKLLGFFDIHIFVLLKAIHLNEYPTRNPIPLICLCNQPECHQDGMERKTRFRRCWDVDGILMLLALISLEMLRVLTWTVSTGTGACITEKTRTTRTPAFWDTPRCPMITHTSDSHQIPSGEQNKVKVINLKKLPKFQIIKFALNFTSNTPSEVAR